MDNTNQNAREPKFMPKRPCVSCIYYDACGSTARTEPCYGRVTLSEHNKSLKDSKKRK